MLQGVQKYAEICSVPLIKKTYLRLIDELFKNFKQNFGELKHLSNQN